ncbi:MAG TPA: hypothetical protein VK169_20850 [Saprospiraceae bacterium]|nr:hypothetical protein [Saprospiraceae bacterium]
MIPKKYPFKSILLVAFSICWFGLFANTNTEKIELNKRVTKEFASNISTALDVNNVYGKVTLKTWDRSFVHIDALVTVKANSKSTAQEKLDEISIILKQSGNNISALTEISSSNSSWWSSWWSGSNNVNIEINYTIQLPANLKINLENRYGNIYLPDYKGKTSIILKYGNLEGKNIENDLMLDLSYGKATMGSVDDIIGDIAYSDYRGINSSTVKVTSKYSKVYLDDVKTMTATSKYDHYKLGDVGSLTMTGAYDDVYVSSLASGTVNAKYSGIEILSLSNSLNMDISYGSLVVNNLKTSFKNMNINTSYAPIKLHGMVASKVIVDGKYCDVNTGSDFIQKSKSSQGSSISLIGYKISERTNAQINITSKYGDVIMK